MSENRIELCGFVFRHGDKDLEAWEVTLDEQDEEAIMDILSKYETCGCSTRNCYDSEFRELFATEENYRPSATNRDYSPSNPWDAPGMSIHDFI